MFFNTPGPRRWLATATLVVLVLAIADWVNPIRPGLRAEYFRNLQWSGEPALSQRDTAPSTGSVIHAWSDRLPDAFSVSWSGYLLVLRTGRYTFETISDDGSWLDVDGRRIIDNGGVHGASRAAAVAALERGVHAVHLEYAQNGGDMTIEWLWGPEGTPLAPPPSWSLTPRRSSFPMFALAAGLQQALTAGLWLWLIVLAAVCARVVWSSSGPVRDWLRDIGAWPALPVILGGSVVLNAIPIWWGLPHGFWPPDELTPKDVALAAAQHFSHGWGERYPPFHFYVLLIAHAPVMLLERVGLVDPGSIAGETLRTLLGRGVSLAAGKGTLFLLFLCARRLFATRAALMATAAFALVAPFVYYSKTANLDVPYLFWFALAFWFLLRVLDTVRLIDIVGFAVAATLSIGTKDQAYGLFALPSLLIVRRLWQAHRDAGHARPMLRAVLDRRLLAGAGLALVVFAAIHNLLFNMSGFRAHVEMILGGASQGYRMFPSTFAGERALFVLTARIVRTALGWPLLVLFAAGAVLAWATPATRRAALIVTLPAVSYYVTFVAVVGYDYDRFLLPVFFLGAMLAGYGMDRWLDVPLPAALRAAVAAGAFGYSLLYVASIDILMLQDSRYTLERFFAAQPRSPERIGFVFPSLYNPRLDAYANGEVTSIEQLQWEQPHWFVLNEDYGRMEPSDTPIGQLVSGLESGALGYAPVLRARTPAPFAWLPAPHRDLTGPRLEGPAGVTSSLRHINPQFVIFERR